MYFWTFKSPLIPNCTGPTQKLTNEGWAELRPTDECFPRMPQSSDGSQARDERIYYGEWWTLCAWLFYAHACNAINYRCLKSKRMHRRGASAAKLRGNEWMQMEWRFKQPSFQSVDETKGSENPKKKSMEVTKQNPKDDCTLSEMQRTELQLRSLEANPWKWQSKIQRINRITDGTLSHPWWMTCSVKNLGS